LKRGFLLFIILNFFNGYGQVGLPIYTDYLTENYYLVHPSMAGVNMVGGKVRLTSRKQWFDQVEAPNLQTLTVDYRLSERSGIGTTIFKDQNGYSAQTGMYLTYAHHINFNESLSPSKRPYPSKDDEINQLSFGISVGGIQNSLDQTTFDLYDFDPLIAGIKQSTGYLNMDVGMSYVTNKYYAHITIKNLLFAPQNMYGETTIVDHKTSLRRLVSSFGYVFYTENPWSFEPSVLFQLADLTKEKSLDVNLKSYYKLRQGRLWAGFSYRNSFEGAQYLDGALLKKQRLQLITPLIGIDYKDFIFSYNYSYQQGNIKFGSGGFHQVTLGFNFGRGSILCDCF
jgi:type IX secretion system PorP/SprF family membrane protein